MTKLFTIFALPAIALTATAGVAADPVKTFTHDGVTYVYTTDTAADGSTIVSGEALRSGAKFRLNIRNGQVTGRANRRPVNFSVQSTRGASNGAIIASRPTRSTSAD